MVNIVSSLASGTIAALLEVFAILLGLLIASNLQAIVSLTAQRRLHFRGTARLRDSTWNIGIIEGFARPWRLLRDYRKLFAFVLALTVVVLEVLTVLQTQTGMACDFARPSTWTIKKSAEKCFFPTAEVKDDTFRAYATSQFVNLAKIKAKDVDLEVGIPVNTNVFEESIISGEAVKQIRDGKYEDRYIAPVIEVFNITADAHVYSPQGTPLVPIEDRSGRETINHDKCKSENEGLQAFPVNIEYPDYETNGSIENRTATGFVQIIPCLEVLSVRICSHAEGRKRFGTDRAGGFAAANEVHCKVYKLSREGRRTDPFSIAVALHGEKNIDASALRRSLLVSYIAQNSASTAPCSRYLASPKRCTEIGWVSLCAISLLLGLFLATLFSRLGLQASCRNKTNYNGSPQRLAEAMFDHFQGQENLEPLREGSSADSENDSASSSFDKSDIHLSVLESNDDQSSHRLRWTRGPLDRKPVAPEI